MPHSALVMRCGRALRHAGLIEGHRGAYKEGLREEVRRSVKKRGDRRRVVKLQ